MDIENWGTPKLRGRGMVKWQPFASIPEQHEEICDLNHNFAKRQAYDSSNSSISRVNYPRYTLGVSK
ncbi:hypothetical protein [Bacillus sp. CH126_4D]|uniref:hypothetical protein n=1 Tax=unclassified Bacillus (in: firmicutes) TaxID=185979 RepID=UPI0039A4683D